MTAKDRRARQKKKELDRQRKNGSSSKNKATTSTKVKGEEIVLDFTTTNSDKESSLTIKLRESLTWLILNQFDMSGESYLVEVEGNVDAVIDSLLKKQIDNNNGNDNDHDNENTLTNNKSIDFIKEHLIESLLDYTQDLSREQSKSIIEKVIPYLIGQVDNYKEMIQSNDGSGGSNNTDDDEEDDNNNIDTEEDDDLYNSDRDEKYVLDGACELCDREIKTTRHHMIPRSTWKQMKPRFLAAKQYFMDGEMDRVINILRTGTIPASLATDDFKSSHTIKQFLGTYTCNVCTFCHKTIHRVFENKNLELAESRNTVEKLLENEEIYNACNWASRQSSRRL